MWHGEHVELYIPHNRVTHYTASYAMVPSDLEYLHNFYNFVFILSFYNFYISETEVATDFFLDQDSEGDSDFLI